MFTFKTPNIEVTVDIAAIMRVFVLLVVLL